MYKKGDKVKVLHTDFPGSISVGDIREVDWATGAGVGLLDNNGKSYAFVNREIEPYQETQNNTMNIHNLKVGDKLGDDTIKKVSSEGIYIKDDAGARLFEFKSINMHITAAINKPNSTWYLTRAKMKEIIGYNIKEEFKGKVDKIAKALGTYSEDTENGTWMKIDSMVYNKAKDLSVLDLWFEPVYKAKEVVVKLSGNRTATIKSKTDASVFMSAGTKANITSTNVAYTLDALNKLGQIGGYNVGIKEFNLGCQTFTIDDLLAVDKAFEDFK